jgi:hypothetical protein
MATRTRPKSLNASRRKRRPGLECLEEKQLLSITFSAYPHGTYAFDSGGAGFRYISPAIPTAMHEGSDGTLFASYSNGTYRYDYGSDHWSQLTTAQATALTASRDNTFFGSYSTGTYEFNGSWHLLTSGIARNLAAVSNENVFLSFDSGTFHYEAGAFTQISPNVPTAMAANFDGTLFASYGGTVHGTWEYHEVAGWTQLDPEPAKELVARSYGAFVGTYSTGTWQFGESAGWKLLSSNEADHLGAAFTDHGVTLIGSYGSTAGGTWIFENGVWTEITVSPAILVD